MVAIIFQRVAKELEDGTMLLMVFSTSALTDKEITYHQLPRSTLSRGKNLNSGD